MTTRNCTTLASILFFAGAAVLSQAALAQQGKLTVAWYGGNWGEAFNACVAEPFTKATGIKVIPEIGTSTTTLAKLQQQKAATTIDVAWMDGGISELAQQAGVLEDLNVRAIPNMANVLDQAVYRSGKNAFAVGTGYYSMGLVYNTKEVKQPPTSWKDLWKPEYAGTVALPSPSNSAGVPIVFFLAKVWGVDAARLDPLYERIRSLNTALFFDSSGAATNAYQSGDAIIGAHFNVGAWDLIDKGVPIGFAVPKEGVWATDARLHIVKGTRNKAAAEQFVNTALSREASTCLATKLYLGPSVKNVTVPSEVARKLPWGTDGSVANLNLLDWNVINQRRAEVTDAWNRQVARKR